MIGLAAIVEAMLAACWVHGHAADGIAHGRCVVRVMAVVVAGVAVAAAAGTLGRFTFFGAVAGLVHDVSGA